VIIAAKPVPGNELAVHDTVNQLWRAGAVVLRQETAPVHVSGHGSAEELKIVLGLARPRHVIPVHGEVRHLHAHAAIARALGVDHDRVFIAELGDCFELEGGEVRRAGKVEAGVAFVDGLGIGAVQDVVLRDRRQLSADGTLVIVCQLHEDGNGVAHPEVIARGFAPEGAEEAESLLADVQTCAAETLARLPERETKIVQAHLHDAIAELVYRRARKRPLVIPIVVEV
jgi:ribonuclease J